MYGDRLTENFEEVIVTDGGIRPDASLYETYVTYDGSMGRADKVKNMYRYGK